MKRVNVDVWSDFVCPWCWIAKRQFEKAVLGLAGQIEVVVTPKAYRLAKGAVAGDFKESVKHKFVSTTAAERMMEMVAERGALEGLKYRFDTMRFGDTSDAHALIKSIESPEDKHLAIERIFQAVTTDGIDIFNREILISLVKDLELPEGALDDYPQIAAEIAQDELEANRIANGVPLFVFNGKSHLSGARGVAEFEKALLQAANEVPESQDDLAGMSCGIEGCAI